MIYVFTRQAFVRPLKNTNTNDVINNVNIIFIDYMPHSIISDSKLSFISNQIQELFNEHYTLSDNTARPRSVQHNRLALL